MEEVARRDCWSRKGEMRGAMVAIFLLSIWEG